MSRTARTSRFVSAPAAGAPSSDTGETAFLDAAIRRIYRSPELAATLEAVLETIVPRHADAVSVSLVEEGADAAIVATRDRDRARDRILAERIGDAPPALRGPLVLPLETSNGTVGALALERRARGKLGESERALLAKIAEHSAQALENARRFEQQRHVALTFQNAALVNELPKVDGFRFDAIYRSGRAEALVGGDWYDLFTLPDGRIVVSIGDVVGSGLEAAIAMVNVRQTIRGVAQVHPDPQLMLAAADRTLRAQHPQRFVTAFVGVIDPVTQRCTYANAGHPAPYVRAHDGTLRQTREHGFPLGLDFSQRLGVDEIVVEPGSLFVLYTDGLTESTHDLIEGEARLETAVRELDAANDGNLAEQVHDAVLGVHARDDVAILVIRAQAAPPLRRWRFDPIWNDVARRVQHELREELRRSGLPPAHYAEVELVFSELLGNAIRYAPGTIEVIAQHRAGAFVLHALDRGPGYLFRPRLPPDLYSEFGRGLFLISRLSDAFTVERRAGGGSHARVEFATYGRPST